MLEWKPTWKISEPKSENSHEFAAEFMFYSFYICSAVVSSFIAIVVMRHVFV